MTTSPWSPPDVQPEPESSPPPVDDDVSPWLDIWWQPGVTMRFFLRHGLAPAVFVLAAAHGVLRMDFGKQLDPFERIVINTLFGPVAGLIGLALQTGWSVGVGRLFEGRGEAMEVATALVWGRLPSTLVLVVLWLVGAVTMGGYVPDEALPVVVLVSLLVWLFGMVWSLTWQTITVAQAHRFGYFQAAVVVVTYPLFWWLGLLLVGAGMFSLM